MENIALEVKNLSKRIGKNQILKDINIKVDKGCVCGLVGPNGAGKTTLFKLITDLITPDTGEICINNRNLRYERSLALRGVGSIIENPDMYDYLTGRQNLYYLASISENVKKEDIDNAIETVKLGKRIDDKVKKYSLGMKQRLGIAQAIMGKPEVLILDEPTNGLDPSGMIDLKKLVRELSTKNNTTILISSHILSELEDMCDKIIFISKGRIVEDEASKNKSAVRKKMVFIRTSQVEKLAKLANSLDNMKIVEKNSDSILINTSLDINPILKAIVSEDIKLDEFYIKEESLENKFIRVMEENKVC